MAKATATVKELRQSPRKVRLVARLIQGKGVDEALQLLDFTYKKASEPVTKAVKSALSNARLNGVTGELVVERLTVDTGPILYRRRPRARGTSNPIRRRSSHISVVLAEKEVVAPTKPAVKKVVKKKTVAKTK